MTTTISEPERLLLSVLSVASLLTPCAAIRSGSHWRDVLTVLFFEEPKASQAAAYIAAAAADSYEPIDQTHITLQDKVILAEIIATCGMTTPVVKEGIRRLFHDDARAELAMHIIRAEVQNIIDDTENPEAADRPLH